MVVLKEIEPVCIMDAIPNKMCFYIMDDEKFVGEIEMNWNNYGVLTPVIKIIPEYRRKGIGFRMFKETWDIINKITPINTIHASWNNDDEFRNFGDGQSTNFEVYKNLVQKGTPINESVFATPTGRWASRLGLSNYRMIADTVDYVNVDFYKDEKLYNPL